MKSSLSLEFNHMPVNGIWCWYRVFPDLFKEMCIVVGIVYAIIGKGYQVIFAYMIGAWCDVCL